MEFVEDMDPEEAVSFICYLREKKVEEKLYRRWCADPQFEMSFDEVKTKLKPVPIMPDEVIIEDVFEIIRDMTGGEPHNGNI
jgi:hypothetical protein